MAVDPVFVGEYILDELRARDWNLYRFADATALHPIVLYDIVIGRFDLTEDIARRIGFAFGTSGDLWMNLSKQAQKRKVDQVERCVQALISITDPVLSKLSEAEQEARLTAFEKIVAKT